MQKEFWTPSGRIFFRHSHTVAIINGMRVFTLTSALSRKRIGIIHPHPDPLPSRERAPIR
jgi:hypothetical protein